jgi:hypothetical protein
MAIFTFYLHDPAHDVPRFEIELLDGPEDAYTAVTITEGDAEVARLLRSAA